MDMESILNLMWSWNVFPSFLGGIFGAGGVEEADRARYAGLVQGIIFDLGSLWCNVLLEISLIRQ